MEKFCLFFRNLFLRAFGSENDSIAVDFTVLASADWFQIASVSKSSKLVFQNLDTAETIYIHWRKDQPHGIRIAAGAVLVLDDIAGFIYAKPVDPTKSIACNMGIISIKDY